MEKSRFIYACSDAVGETAETIARATTRQFPGETIRVRRFGHIQSEEEIKEILTEVKRTGGIIAYTLVQPELQDTMRKEAHLRNIKAIDVLGPMMQAYTDTYNHSPSHIPGDQQSLDEEYFKRIEAIEFAVKYDDGKDMSGLLKAEVILIGVSRTSKTPLSIFLAHKRIKTANLPIVPDTKPPEELFQASQALVIGLTIEPEQLLKIRKERLKSLGLPDNARYASMEQIKSELQTAESIMEQTGCHIINVADRSIEETAGIIVDLYAEKTAADKEID